MEVRSTVHSPLKFNAVDVAVRLIMLCYVPCYCSLELTLRCMRVGGRRVGAAYMG